MMHATTAVATSNIHQIHLAAKPSQKSPRPPSRAPSLPSPSQYAQFADQIHYSARYSDDVYEYRHVIVPKNMLRAMPKWYFRSPHHAPNGVLRLLTEDEWRSVGITQSLGWEHYVGIPAETSDRADTFSLCIVHDSLSQDIHGTLAAYMPDPC